MWVTVKNWRPYIAWGLWGFFSYCGVYNVLSLWYKLGIDFRVNYISVYDGGVVMRHNLKP